MLMMFRATLFGGQPDGDSLSLNQVVNVVLSKHPALRQAAEQMIAADIRTKQTESAWNPTVGLEAGYTRLAPIVEIEFGSMAFRMYPSDNYDVHVTARQLVYDFGKNAASADANRSRTEIAKSGIELIRTSLAYQTIQLFYTALYLRSAIAVQNEQIRTLQEHIDVAKKRIAAGTATDFDVLTTEVRAAAAQNQLIDLQNAERKAQIQIGRLMGRENGDLICVKGDFERMHMVLDGDSLVQIAYHQRPEIITALKEEEASRLQVRVAEISDRPTLNAGISYGLKNGYLPNLDVLRGNIAAAIKLEVPIYDGGRTDYRREETEASLRGVQARSADTKLQAAQEVRQAVSDLRSGEDKLAATELQVTQAREALSIARKRYDTGTISNIDLLDTQTALLQADLQHLQALFSCSMNRYMVFRAIGSEAWQ